MTDTIDLDAVVDMYRANQRHERPAPTRASPFQQLLTTLVRERTEKIIDSLVASHRNKEITAQEALSAVASIFVLRCLVSDLSTKTQRSAQLGPIG